jgi:hypothetical protein
LYDKVIESKVWEGSKSSLYKIIGGDELHLKYRRGNFREKMEQKPEIVAWKR